MQIPILKALDVKIIGRAVSPILPPLLLSIEDTATNLGFDDNFEYLAKVVVGFSQIGPRGAEIHVRQRAVRSIANHIYGPVEQELRLVMEDLWRMGVSSNATVIQRLERIISGLRGQDC